MEREFISKCDKCLMLKKLLLIIYYFIFNLILDQYNWLYLKSQMAKINQIFRDKIKYMELRLMYQTFLVIKSFTGNFFAKNSNFKIALNIVIILIAYTVICIILNRLVGNEKTFLFHL
ncbi:hypothetical protein KUTeg_016949 [Tegillarca granosa]|uniref:Uncharacterized protein n=1 Tax=Tegillarca granosa TaxID=220873 RepID=A0ABQ9EN93_TEGGR|nr:hypothetical protein KUTeg_016949 [Tegillarca granosa]